MLYIPRSQFELAVHKNTDESVYHQMQNLDCPISVHDYSRAISNWYYLFGKPGVKEFNKFLGKFETTWDNQLNAAVLMITEEGNNKIKMLCSPHYRALMHAYIAKNGPLNVSIKKRHAPGKKNL
jgi:hypothetical protein